MSDWRVEHDEKRGVYDVMEGEELITRSAWRSSARNAAERHNRAVHAVVACEREAILDWIAGERLRKEGADIRAPGLWAVWDFITARRDADAARASAGTAGEAADQNELRKVFTRLLCWAPGFPREVPAYGELPMDDAPFFSEAYLYELLGKEDARTLLSFVNRMARALGFETYRDVAAEARRAESGKDRS